MSVLAAGVARRPVRVGPSVWSVLLALATAVALAFALSSRPPSLALALGGGIGAVCVLLLALVRYDWAVGLGIVLLFFVKKEPAPTDAVFLIVIAVALVTGRFALSRVPAVISALVGAYLLLEIASFSAVRDPSRAFRFMFVTVYLGVFALWLASWVRSRRRAQIVTRAYVFAAVLSAALGSLAYVGGPGRSTLLEYGGTRAVGLFKDPNVFGAFLVPAALIVIDELLVPKLLESRRVAKTLMFLVLTLGIVFSYSRAAFISLGVGVAVMIAVHALRRGGGRRAFTLFSALVVAAVLTAVALAATGSVQFLESRAQVQSYDTNRFNAQAAGFGIVAQHPFGVGPGQFEDYAPLSAHSTYVRALAETGILGLVVVLALVLATLILAARNAVLGLETYGVGSTPLLGAWAGLVLSGFVIDTLHWRHLWVVAALIWAGSMRRYTVSSSAGPTE